MRQYQSQNQVRQVRAYLHLRKQDFVQFSRKSTNLQFITSKPPDRNRNLMSLNEFQKHKFTSLVHTTNFEFY